MTAIEQKTFFGASIRGFNVNLGWGSQVSTLEIDLVEDFKNGDAFSPNTIGFPAYFTYYNFFFGGIVQKYGRTGSFQGNPLYRVTLIDPREILDGVQVVIDGYTGATAMVPNLYNVYGYLETQVAYGASQVNETGMPWKLLGDTLVDLVNITPINFRGQPFYLNLANLPQLPIYHRIGGGISLSVMEYISRVCEDGACDFFFSLEAGNIITVYTVSRAEQPVFGAITNFIGQAQGAIANEIGLELRNETTSRFLVGGPVCKMFIQTPSEEETEEDFEDDTITQYWGLKEDGNPVIMEYFEDDKGKLNHRFTLASRSVNVVGVGETYDTDIFEMRAALGGQASWEAYLWTQNEVVGSPHFDKAKRIGLLGPIDTTIGTVIKDKTPTKEAFKALDIREFAPLTGKKIADAAGALDKDSDHEENLTRLYNYVLSFAQEYYGRKFMVRVPFVFAKISQDAPNTLITSQEPAEGGFVEESEYANAIGNKLMPTYTNLVSKEDGRLICYVRFDDVDNLHADLSENDYVIDDGSIFIKCEVDPQLIFLDRTTAFSPRAVVTLPAPIYPKGEDGIDFRGILESIIEDRAIKAPDAVPVPGLGIPEDEAKVIIDNIFKRLGAEQILLGWAGIAETPDMVAVPMQSNILTYGPWYAVGAEGATEFEQDTTLVPWNYGGYTAMNLAGEARVVEALAQQQVSEAGSIEVPGAPNVNIGSVLLAAGPYVTGLSCQIGLDGVTTSYRMETWTPRFGKVYKQNTERIAKLSRNLQADRRTLREFIKTPPVGSAVYKQRADAIIKPPEAVKRGSTMAYLGGEILTDSATNLGKSNVVALPTYHVPTQIGGSYEKKALMTLDGLLIPFSTNFDNDLTTSSGLPHYERPTASGTSGRSVTELNPFASGHNIAAIANGSGLNETQRMFDQNYLDLRPLALRGPLVLAGWGYDTNGKPVPNANPASPTANFLENHKQRPDQWKVGPVDMKWNQTRGVWVTGGGDFEVAKLITHLYHGSFASGIKLQPNIHSVTGVLSGWTEQSGQYIRIYDGLVGITTSILFPISPSGARVYIQREASSNQYFVTSANVF